MIDLERENNEVLPDEDANKDETMVPSAWKRTSKTSVFQKPEKKSRNVLAPLLISANRLQQIGTDQGKSRETIALPKLEDKKRRRKVKYNQQLAVYAHAHDQRWKEKKNRLNAKIELYRGQKQSWEANARE